MAGIQEEIQTMNIYDLHSNPEELHGYSTREYKLPEFAYDLAKDNPELRPKLEPVIMKDPEYALKHAMFVKNKPWPEAEPYIMKNPQCAYYYAKDVLDQRRWPEAEPVIMKHTYLAYRYALDVLGRRWPEAEQYIMKDKISWYSYKREFYL